MRKFRSNRIETATQLQLLLPVARKLSSLAMSDATAEITANSFASLALSVTFHTIHVPTESSRISRRWALSFLSAAEYVGELLFQTEPGKGDILLFQSIAARRYHNAEK